MISINNNQNNEPEKQEIKMKVEPGADFQT